MLVVRKARWLYVYFIWYVHSVYQYMQLLWRAVEQYMFDRKVEQEIEKVW